MEPRDAAVSEGLRARATHALRQRRVDRVRREPGDPVGARRARRWQDRLAGNRDRARDARKLRRQQALVVSGTTLRRTLGAVVAVAALAFVSSAFAAPPLTRAKQHLTQARAIAIFEADDKVADWLARYPRKRLSTSATYEPDSSKCGLGAQGGCWDVSVSDTRAGEIAKGKVDDVRGAVTEAWTGPQVAWTMARGGKGAFGGTRINSLRYWLPFCFVFLLGLADLRRPLSLRNLDLLVLLSFSVSLWYFNRGDILTSVPLAYPPPVCLLAAATVFVAGFRIGLNVSSSNVIDVGYSGVIGAQRIANGQVPYGNFPVEESLKACGPAAADGEIRERVQTNGRCESANPQGDTYGPIA